MFRWGRLRLLCVSWWGRRRRRRDVCATGRRVEGGQRLSAGLASVVMVPAGKGVVQLRVQRWVVCIDEGLGRWVQWRPLAGGCRRGLEAAVDSPSLATLMSVSADGVTMLEDRIICFPLGSDDVL